MRNRDAFCTNPGPFYIPHVNAFDTTGEATPGHAALPSNERVDQNECRVSDGASSHLPHQGKE